MLAHGRTPVVGRTGHPGSPGVGTGVDGATAGARRVRVAVGSDGRAGHPTLMRAGGPVVQILA